MRVAHVTRHLVEMVVAMVVGMVASAGIFVAVSGATVDESLRRHAVLFVAVQAVGMTVPMVAVMLRRGHTRRDCAEMSAAMLLPGLVLIVLRSAHAISGPICGAYCALSFLAMVLLVVYRRDAYVRVAPVA